MNRIIKTFFVVLHHPTETTHYFYGNYPFIANVSITCPRFFCIIGLRPSHPWPVVIPSGAPLSFRSRPAGFSSVILWLPGNCKTSYRRPIRNSEGLRFDVLQVSVSQVLLHGRPAGLMDRQAEWKEDKLWRCRNDRGDGLRRSLSKVPDSTPRR